MIIKSLKMYNFSVYSGEQEINFAYKNNNDSTFITIIGGLNGRGKTSILEAILLVLYGSRSPKFLSSKKSYGDYLSGLIHGRGAKGSESWLQLEFQLNQDTIKIRRSWKKKNRVSESIHVWINDIENPYFSQNIESFIQEQIPTSISELFFFDGEQISVLAESDEPVDSIKKAFQFLLGIETVDRLIQDLDLLIKKKRNEQNKAEGSHILNELLEVTEKIKVLEKKREKLLQERASIVSKINHTNKVLERIKSEYAIAGGGNNQELLMKRRDELQKKLEELKVNIGSLVAGVFPLLLVENQLLEVKNSIHKEQESAQARNSLSVIRKISEDILRSIKASNVDEMIYRSVESLISDKIKTLEKKAESKTVFPIGLTMSNQIDQVLDTLLSDKDLGLKIINQYEDIERELKQIEANIMLEPDINNLKELLSKQKEAELNLLRYEKELATVEESINELNKEEERLRSRISEISQKKAEFDESERVIRYAAQTLINMKNFKVRLTEKKIIKLSDHIHEAFTKLTNKSEFVNKIVVDPESYNVKLFDREGIEISKNSLSSGERHMLALSILWGLAKASGKRLPVIVDSPLGRLDSLHRNSLINTYFPNASHQVVILSTDTELDDKQLEKIDKYIGKKYILLYDEESESSSVTEGYFNNSPMEMGQQI